MTSESASVTETPIQPPELMSALFAQYEPPRRWEGRVKGASGSARNADFGMILTLALAAGLAEGDGRSPEFPLDVDDAQRQFHVTGARHGDVVTFELYFFAHPYFRSRPSYFDGRLDAEERTITGGWTFQCEPSCSCGGSAGAFTLTRVD